MTTSSSQQPQKQLYKLKIGDREYKSWSFVDPDTNTPKQLSTSESIINPANLKLFSDDLVDLSTPIPTVLYSPTKSKPIPGVLLLAENKTYGRTSNNKRLLYKCVPNNPEIPAFLVPYQPDILFSKTQKNRYVVFRFDNWNSKYPQGILIENLGDTDNLPAFYEYQLFCRNIHHQIGEFNVAAKKIVKILPDIKANNPKIFQDTETHKGTNAQKGRIFSIDPEGTRDFDDAFSISKDSPFTVKIRIYIANVYAWMELMGLWSSFGERVCTIYLPDSRRPMLPTILSESVCSLAADKTQKLAFCMELRVRVNSPQTDSKTQISTTPLIIPDSVRFFNQSIVVDKNHIYESKDLLADPDYKLLHKCTQILDPMTRDSHDVVSYWMIQMNTICGEWLHERGVGIFREVSINKSEDPEPPFSEIPHTTKILLKNWKNTTGKYICCDSTQRLVIVKHEAMEIDSYVHITSPIRRLVDLLNQIIFQREFGLINCPVSREAEEFLENWSARIDELNVSMRSIRKTQIDCDMLFRCNAHPEWMQHPHRGVIFDRIEKHDGNYSYTVHLPDLNILGRTVSQEKYINYQVLDFRLFTFHDSDKLQRKIRLAII